MVVSDRVIAVRSVHAVASMDYRSSLVMQRAADHMNSLAWPGRQ